MVSAQATQHVPPASQPQYSNSRQWLRLRLWLLKRTCRFTLFNWSLIETQLQLDNPVILVGTDSAWWSFNFQLQSKRLKFPTINQAFPRWSDYFEAGVLNLKELEFDGKGCIMWWVPAQDSKENLTILSSIQSRIGKHEPRFFPVGSSLNFKPEEENDLQPRPLTHLVNYVANPIIFHAETSGEKMLQTIEQELQLAWKRIQYLHTFR